MAATTQPDGSPLDAPADVPSQGIDRQNGGGLPTHRPGSLQKPKETGPRAWRHPPSILLFFLVLVLALAADLVSKKMAFQYVAGQPVQLTRENSGTESAVPYHQPIVLIPYILSLRLTTNTGAVFGLGKGGQMVFVIVSVLAVAIIGRVFCASRAGAWLLHASLGLILAGALGNLHDRLSFNAVRDLLWLFPQTGLWPWIFNVADASLLIGVVLMMGVVWRSDRPQPADQTTPD